MPRQPRITGVTSLLKEAGVTLSPDQTGALTKFLATVGDQALDVPSLWKAEAGVPRELLESDWFSQDADGRNEEYGPTRIDHRTRSTCSEDLGPPRVREPLLRLRDSGCLVLMAARPLRQTEPCRSQDSFAKQAIWMRVWR